MTTKTELNNDISEQSEILSYFYPKLKSNSKKITSNENSKLVKIIKKNKNISKLIYDFDMIEV